MVHHVLELPPELLNLILASLPVRSLLKFSETSRYTRVLANSNLHILQLGIEPIRALNRNKYSDDEIYMRIPHARTYDYTTLLKFHNALVHSILVRHADTLRTVNLSLWTISTPIAKGLSALYALQNLSIRIEDDMYARAVPRPYIALERREQHKAWNLLGQTAVWKDRLRTLKIENADLNISQLAALLQYNRRCQEMWLGGCRYIGKDLWQFLGCEWDGRLALRSLHVAECGRSLVEEDLAAISGLRSLQVSYFQHRE